MELRKPYLLFLADAQEPAAAKTAAGVAYWRPADCVAELRYDEATVSVGRPRMTIDQAVAAGARSLVSGTANSGGFLTERQIQTMRAALDAGLDLIAGMHMRLRDVPALRDRARELGRQLHDLRDPPPSLPVGTGAARSGRRVLTVGTDCSVGKMYTALAIERELRARGQQASFRATGQTGILIAGSGIPVDAVVADFISGAVETLTPSIPAEHWHIVEGQGSLFHPGFAGVSLGLLHGAAPHAMVLCHDPTRATMRGATGYQPAPIDACLQLNETLAQRVEPVARVVGIAVNTVAYGEDEAHAALERLALATGLPAVDPVRTGVADLVDALQKACR